MTNKYLSKQIEVEAVQFNDDNKDMVINWARELQGNVQNSFDENKQPIMLIPTLEGEMTCSFGDYLVREPFPTDWRKVYPVKKDIFEKRYDLLS